MEVLLLAAPPALHARALALVGGRFDDPPAVDGSLLTDVLPDGVVPGPGWPQPDDLVGFAASTGNRLVVVDGAVVGGVGPIGEPVDGVQEVGYGIVPAVRRQGVSDRALQLLVAELFAADPSLTAVSAEVLESNTPSWKLLERTGFARTADPGRAGHRRYLLAR